MSTIIGSARSDENKKYLNGQPGDQRQTKTPDYSGEVSMQSFYVHSKGWYVLRAKDIKDAINIAAKMIYACNNTNLGYDQGSTRLGVIENGIETKTATGCDCSSLVRACVKEATNVDPGNFHTGNEIDALMRTGLFDEPVAYTSDFKLKKGDILVTKSKGHTAIVVIENDSVAVPEKNQNGVNKPDNSELIWKFLANYELNDYAIAGIMGNLYVESALRPNNLQNSYEKKLSLTDDEYTHLVDTGAYSKEKFSTDQAGYGLAQWTSSGRKRGLYEFWEQKKKSTGSYISISDIDLQVEWLVKEIHGKLMKKLNRTKSVREASDIVLHEYERPADQSEAVEKTRAGYGQTFYDLYAKADQAVEKTEEPKFVKQNDSYRVKVSIDNLNVRTGPGVNYPSVGFTGIGVFTIVDTTEDRWGKLKSGKGWISLKYTERI